MEILKVKDWLKVKEGAQFKNIIETPKAIVMVQRIKDDCIFKLGLITFDNPSDIDMGVVAIIHKFHHDKIHVDIISIVAYVTSEFTIDINDIVMNNDGNRVSSIIIKNNGRIKV